MRYSPIRIGKGAGDGTQPAPDILLAERIRTRGRIARIAVGLVLLAILFVALLAIWAIAGDPFRDD